MADYDWFSEEQYARNQQYAEDGVWRAKGLHPVYIHRGGVSATPAYYQCRRGCGTLVWDAEAHIKNVCTTFAPVVGVSGA